MCGRFASTLPPDAMRALFRTTNALVNVAPIWNVAPSQSAMVVRRHPETGERHLDLLRWGLLPRFTTDLKTARKPINARSETAATLGTFRGALARRRAIVPAALFYEWVATPTGKQPYAIARRDGSPLALAGLWEGWRSREGEVIRSFAILTTAANALMSRLHERMPVVLEPDDWATWLGEEPGDAPALMRPAAEGVLHLWPVSRAVNDVRNNGPELVEPIDDATVALGPSSPADPPPGSNPA